ncbi:hypothetical protein Bca52824_040181 [Brassica carinata]|uniref:Uncharacterized protein n=1 Tax=Brassica carinata TaxID=52824 RepID=A0A8X7RT15_BRACI|nr:hypothetical protein Bca52824_040181 [Brassica carinata]
MSTFKKFRGRSSKVRRKIDGNEDEEEKRIIPAGPNPLHNRDPSYLELTQKAMFNLWRKVRLILRLQMAPLRLLPLRFCRVFSLALPREGESPGTKMPARPKGRGLRPGRGNPIPVVPMLLILLLLST